MVLSAGNVEFSGLNPSCLLTPYPCTINNDLLFFSLGGIRHNAQGTAIESRCSARQAMETTATDQSERFSQLLFHPRVYTFSCFNLANSAVTQQLEWQS
jgi:hypothetical protein